MEDLPAPVVERETFLVRVDLSCFSAFSAGTELSGLRRGTIGATDAASAVARGRDRLGAGIDAGRGAAASVTLVGVGRVRPRTSFADATAGGPAGWGPTVERRRLLVCAAASTVAAAASVTVDVAGEAATASTWPLASSANQMVPGVAGPVAFALISPVTGA